jgi:hypothetical protein
MDIRPPLLRLAMAVACLALGAAACGGTADSPAQSSASPSASALPTARGEIVWPAPPDPMDRTVEAGLQPQPKEGLAYHVHAHLDVFVDGESVTVPAGIGININDPAVRRFDEPDGSVGYGGIKLCTQPCISPLHTHDRTGIIHTESLTPQPNTLGQFFTEWGVTLRKSCVAEYCSPTPIAIYVNGELHSGDPQTIELADQSEIAIVIGTPPLQIPSTADFSRA